MPPQFADVMQVPSQCVGAAWFNEKQHQPLKNISQVPWSLPSDEKEVKKEDDSLLWRETFARIEKKQSLNALNSQVVLFGSKWCNSDSIQRFSGWSQKICVW